MIRSIDISKFQGLPDIVGEDDEDTEQLKEQAAEAEAYLKAKRWCPPIKRIYLAYGIGGVIALFLVEFERPIAGHDDAALWVVTGDLPPAYFVLDDALTPKDALDTYCSLMEEWAERAKAGKSVADCYPVVATPNKEHGEMLAGRMEYIRENIISEL